MRAGARRLRAAALGLGLALGCGGEAEPPPATPPEVIVVAAERRAIPDRRAYVGTVRAVDAVDVRARVRGFLVEQAFTEGERVARGQVLFRIDPSEYEVRVRQARARLAEARATAARAERDFARSVELRERDVVPESTLDAQRAARDEARAAVEAAEAELAAAELDLSYTVVRSPLDGRVGLAQVDVGNLVGQDGQDTVLTRVTRVDPVHVYFAPAVTHRLGRRYVDAEGAADEAPSLRLPVAIELAGGGAYPHEGVVDFVDPTVDPELGTVQARASVPNPDGTLKPGEFVRVTVVFPDREAVVVPARAIRAEQGETAVLVVGADDEVDFRRIELGIAVDGLREVAAGLEPGERVIVEGQQKARPGARVVARPLDAAAGDAERAAPGAGAPAGGADGAADPER